MPSEARARAELRFAMNLSLWIGLSMFFLKAGAYLLTGSSAILSDAAESVVHVAAVCFAAYSLRLADKPADAGHPYGHARISFFSAGFEGAMIMIAAVYIIVTALAKWIGGLELENLGWGMLLTGLASAINGALGGYLVWMGKRKGSIILEANGRHVLTDCWTSAGAILGVGLAWLTGWLPWDPIFAILLSLNILFSGIDLVRRGAGGLMDAADPKVRRQLEAILDRQSSAHGISYHALRHRNVGDCHWIEVHFLFPAHMPIAEAHQIATEIEEEIEETIKPAAQVTSHLEAIDDHGESHAHKPH